MTTQLTLLAASTTATTAWQLDDRTRSIGRQGLAQARQALADARTRCGDAIVDNDPFSRAA
jgi:hypothetical protein